MKYMTLGQSGLIVSRVALGTMTFADSHKDQLRTLYKVGQALANEIVGKAIDAGINFFDTADVYACGDAETILGTALRGRRDQVVVASKVGLRPEPGLLNTGLSRRHILRSIDGTLARLGTDWLDVYLVHRLDHLTPLEETLEALNDVVRAGKVRYLGFSNWPAWRAAEAVELQRANGWARFTHGQMYYSLLGRDVERDIVPMMTRYGLGMVTWSPLAFGFLSGKISRETIDGQDSRFSEISFLRVDREAGFRLLDVLREIAAAHEVDIPQIALAWLLAREAVNSILIGVSGPAQLDANLKALEVVLSPEELARLDGVTALAPAYPNWTNESLADPAVSAALAPK